MKKPTAFEVNAGIAEKIDAYLKRFESSENTNPLDPKHGTRPFYWARCYAVKGSPHLRVVYVSYQGAIRITREEALNYLADLEDGYVGQHWHGPRGSSTRMFARSRE